jgi:7,8-dihydropterin-6-yl-methyl-4-(beta-D-ribofuranosyl)aminobenzene 5'-phosphate synthase
LNFDEKEETVKVRLTVLCENSVGVPFGVIGEHGFACYLETEAGNYLFDTGQGYAILPNSLALNKDLRNINAIMISHGHYDHTGGLPAVLRLSGPVNVYGHPDIFIDRIRTSEGHCRFIGMPFTRRYLESLGAAFFLDKDMVEIGKGLFLTGEIPRTNAIEKGDETMTALLPGGETIHPDPLKDDLSLIIVSDRGLVLILGCAHAGLVNIIDYVIERLNRKDIYAVIGGTHLAFSTEEQFVATMDVMDRFGIKRIGVSHCTGPLHASRLHAKFKERFFFANVGFTMNV